MEDLILNIASVPAIVLIVYWIVNLLKIVTNNNEKFKRFIPVVACGTGVILGIVIYFAVPQMIMAENIIYAIIIGGSSGLAATGTNQIFKQLSSTSASNSEDETKNTNETNTTDDTSEKK